MIFLLCRSPRFDKVAQPIQVKILLYFSLTTEHLRIHGARNNLIVSPEDDGQNLKNASLWRGCLRDG